MNTQNQINFIAGKIDQLQTALLHIHSNSLLKFPTSVAEKLHIDELGCVWVAINKPTQYVHEFDRSFHVGLNFYKKGKAFYLNTYGLARVVTDPEEMNHVPATIMSQLNDRLLICVRILEANYYETQPKQVQNIFQKCRQTLSDLFIGSDDYYHFKAGDIAEVA
jgi:general stress protein 26